MHRLFLAEGGRLQSRAGAELAHDPETARPGSTSRARPAFGTRSFVKTSACRSGLKHHLAGAAIGLQLRRPDDMHSSARRASSIALTSQMPPAISTAAPTSKMILAVLRSASVSSSSRFGSAMRLEHFPVKWSRFTVENATKYDPRVCSDSL